MQTFPKSHLDRACKGARKRASNYLAPIVKLISALSLGLTIALLAEPGRGAEQDAWQYNRILGPGINLGSALEAPDEGDWGVTLKPEYFQAIQEAGFKSVRIPIRWSAHALSTPPYTIAPSFLARVDWAIRQALARNLSVVIDVHHYYELSVDPDQQLPRLVALWDQIASHYKDFPDTLFFELVNEPQGNLTDDKWQTIFPELLRTVRKTNPDRMVIIGPGYWNSLHHLNGLNLPDDDRRLIATFHYYVPMRFTHQGVAWVYGADQWKGTTWTGTPEEQEVLRDDFDKAAAWANENRRPLYLGEFGSYNVADMASRARWAGAVVLEAKRHGMSWAYFDFCSSTFGAYDAQEKSWRGALLHALIIPLAGAGLNPLR